VPKVNVYLPDELAAAVRDAQVPLSAVCQAALERAVRDVHTLRGSEDSTAQEPAHGPFTRFTPRARTAISHAQTEARERGHASVGTEHLLLGVLRDEENLALRVLAALDVEAGDLRTELIASMEPASRISSDRAPFTPLAKRVLEVTTKEAVALGHNYVGCEHLLLGLLATEEGLASQVLRRMGLELRTTRRTVVGALSGFLHGRDRDASQPAPATGMLEEILRRLEAIEARLAG
jgi:ATP-dependent Clp protease ATP-binding subunit ClpA